MAFTQSDLDAIERAIVSGSLSVAYDGKSVSFRSMADLLRVRRIIMNALGLLGQPATLRAAHDRGYGGSQPLRPRVDD